MILEIYKADNNEKINFDSNYIWMARFKITLEYDGSPYFGWQFQKNKPSVMGVIMDACKTSFGTDKFEIYGAGRTDAGVHALAQVAHLDIKTNLRPDIIRMNLNDALPATVNIRWVELVSPGFHARHDAKARSYVYHIATRRTAFGKKYAYWIKDTLDIDLMNRGAKLFEGMHDFRSFGSSEDKEASTKVQIYKVTVQKQGASVLIHIVGSHFLWKMVRRITGVLLECGRGNLNTEDIIQFMKTKSDVPAKLTVPPSGLFLERIFYDEVPEEFEPAWPMIIQE
jgi:tRNA pseudouridine38-40 synthase